MLPFSSAEDDDDDDEGEDEDDDERNEANGQSVDKTQARHANFNQVKVGRQMRLLTVALLLAASAAFAGGETGASSSNATIVANLLAAAEQNATQLADRTERDSLIKLLSTLKDTRSKNSNLIKIYELLGGDGEFAGAAAETQKRRRKIVFEDTIFQRRALKEVQANMSVSFEGESVSDQTIQWVVMSNASTILVVRTASKYYYWTYGQTAGALVIFCMIVAGNLSILHRLKSCRRRRSNVNYFIVQLAIADLLVGVFCVSVDSVLRLQREFQYGLVACKASKYISGLFIYSSTNLLVALSIDRWEAVVKPLAFTRNRSRGYHLAACAWLLAAVCAFPVTLFSRIELIEGLPQCWIKLSADGWKLYIVYLTCVILVVPTLVIAICYTHIVYTIWRKGRLVARQRQSRRRQLESTAAAASFALAAADEVAVATAAAAPRETTCRRGAARGANGDENNNQVGPAGGGRPPNSLCSTATLESCAEEQSELCDSSSLTSATSSPPSSQSASLATNRRGAAQVDAAASGCANKMVRLTQSGAPATGAAGASAGVDAGVDLDGNKLAANNNDNTTFSTSADNDVGRLRVREGRRRRRGRPNNKRRDNFAGAALVGEQTSSAAQASRADELPRTRDCHKDGGAKLVQVAKVRGLGAKLRLPAKHADDAHQSGAASATGTRRGCGTQAAQQHYVAQQHGSGVIPKARIKTIKMTLVIVVAYILCWSPFCILNLCSTFNLISNDTNISLALMTLSQSLAHLNSAVNPIIFWLFSSKRNASSAAAAARTKLAQQQNAGTGAAAAAASPSENRRSSASRRQVEEAVRSTGISGHLLDWLAYLLCCCNCCACWGSSQRLRSRLQTDSRMFESTGTTQAASSRQQSLRNSTFGGAPPFQSPAPQAPIKCEHRR